MPNSEGEPDSPRVSKFVELGHSSSWMLEYDGAELELGGSPNLKRKLSPHSPMATRKSTRRPNASNDVMSRSLTNGIYYCFDTS